MTTRLIRALLIVGAVPVAWYGLSLIWEMSPADIMSIVVWLIAGLIVHDAVFAPLCIAAGHAAKNILPQRWWAPVLAGGSATVLLVLLALPVILPRPEGKAAPGGNESLTILDRPYGLGLTLAVLVIWALVVVMVVRNRHARSHPHDDIAGVHGA